MTRRDTESPEIIEGTLNVCDSLPLANEREATPLDGLRTAR
jgi:hypothetical protein